MRINHHEKTRITAYWRAQEQDNYRELDRAIHALRPRKLRRWQWIILYALFAALVIANTWQFCHLVYNWLLCQ
jgi:hypothetical protein